MEIFNLISRCFHCQSAVTNRSHVLQSLNKMRIYIRNLHNFKYLWHHVWRKSKYVIPRCFIFLINLFVVEIPTYKSVYFFVAWINYRVSKTDKNSNWNEIWGVNNRTKYQWFVQITLLVRSIYSQLIFRINM